MAQIHSEEPITEIAPLVLTYKGQKFTLTSGMLVIDQDLDQIIPGEYNCQTKCKISSPALEFLEFIGGLEFEDSVVIHEIEAQVVGIYLFGVPELELWPAATVMTAGREG